MENKSLAMENEKLSFDAMELLTIGRWACEIGEDTPPALHADPVMLELLGLGADARLTPQEIYRYWYDRVAPDYYKILTNYTEKMVEGAEPEVYYHWHHPSGRVVKVRCRGKRNYAYTNGILMQGMHTHLCDVVDISLPKVHEVERVSEADTIFAQTTRKLFAFSLLVNLKTGTCKIISGTGGMSEALQDMLKSRDYRECYANIIKHTHEKDQGKLRELISLDFLRASKAPDGHSCTFEYGAEYNGNRNLWREVNVFFSTGEDGTRFVNILFRDVTERHEKIASFSNKQAALMERDRMLSDILTKLFMVCVNVNLSENTFDYTIGSDADYLLPILRASGEYSVFIDRMLGIICPEWRDEVYRLIGLDYLSDAKVQNIPIGRSTCELNLCGVRYWHSIVVFRSTGPDGAPRAMILCRDVTQAKNLADRREKEKYAASLRDRIFSEVARTLYGYTIAVNLNTGKYELMVGEGSDEVAALFAHEDRYEKALELKMRLVDPTFAKALHDLISLNSLKAFSEAGKEGFIQTYKFKVHIGARERWHETSVFIGVNERGEAVANLLGRDVTEIHLQQDLEMKAEREANKARSYFFSTVSHDIRTPLNAIIGYTELLKLGIDDKAEREHAIDSIVTSGQTLMDLINDVLDLSKLESGRMEIVPEPADVQALVHETVGAFSLNCSMKNIDLIEKVEPMPRLVIDPHRVRQVLFNLVGNAVKFTDKGSVTVEVTWKDSTLLISVIDTGCGIAKSDFGRLMTPYVQVRGAGRHGGTGLGLAISRQLAGRMGGEISFDSEYGKGTVFRLELPMVKAAQAQDTAKAPNAPKTEKPPLNFDRVLIVDDSPVNLKVLAAMLRRVGITNVTAAHSGEEGFEFFRKGHFDLVLTDLWMPDMNGVALVEKLRVAEKIAARTPTLVCAVTADVEAVKQETASKFDGILLKPLALDNLTALIASLRTAHQNGGGGVIMAVSAAKARFLRSESIPESVIHTPSLI